MEILFFPHLHCVIIKLGGCRIAIEAAFTEFQLYSVRLSLSLWNSSKTNISRQRMYVCISRHGSPHNQPVEPYLNSPRDLMSTDAHLVLTDVSPLNESPVIPSRSAAEMPLKTDVNPAIIVLLSRVLVLSI